MRFFVLLLVQSALAVGTFAVAQAVAPPSPPRHAVLLGGPDPDVATPANPRPAIVLTRFGNSQCTACIIGPRRKDGSWLLFTAAHCGGMGARGSARLSDGRNLSVAVVARSTKSDGSILRTTSLEIEALPFATLATARPERNEPVWHAGYGVDRPGNVEKGYVRNPLDSNGQTEFWLSVSPGDSGGPIIAERTGLVLASTCCTTRLAGPGRVWGCSAIAAADLIASLDGRAPRAAKMFASSPASRRPPILIVPSLMIHGDDAPHD